MADENKNEDWMQKKWRPAMGWMYMVVCICDFVVFPVLWSILQAVLHTANITQWNPLTLQGAGLFHLAMGAVLGIAAYGRTQEKLGGSAVNASTSNLPPTSSISTPAPVSFSVQSTPGPAVVGFGGKAAPPAAYQPEL